jgi:hypothetical protein
MDLDGLEISEGIVVSTQDGPANSAVILFDATNNASIIFTNWPATNTAGIHNAISGMYPILVDGTNISYKYLNDPDFVHGVQPRTALGLSQDRRYLFLLVIDGRQGGQVGYSDGAWDFETAEWLLMLGAHDGINMDGGGSTTLSMENSLGEPVMLNYSSAVANDPLGRQRTVGGHFGVFAKPAPGFINDIVVTPGDTNATIAWTTVEPSTTQVQYNTTTNLTNSSVLESTPVTNHLVQLTGLVPGIRYYYWVLSNTGATNYSSPIRVFTTTSLTTVMLELTNSWRYRTANLDNTNWTSLAYNDSNWAGPEPALLWYDQPVNSHVEPRNTQLPLNPGSGGYPYITYYFRTHFAVTNTIPQTALQFTAFVDDGAVFYLNGAEIQRIRMDPYPTPIVNATLASETVMDPNYPNEGDASAPDIFSISGDSLTNLVVGDNVLAVEVHNYHQQSRDITFGTSLSAIGPHPIVVSPQLNISYTNTVITLSWSASGFTLQQTATITNGWTDVTGPVVTSPYSITNATDTRFYRLRN